MVKNLSKSHKKKTMILSASEIGQYNYCAISWYLQRMGYRPDSEALHQGKKIHYELGKTIDSVQKETRKAWRLIFISIVLLILAVLLYLVVEVMR